MTAGGPRQRLIPQSNSVPPKNPVHWTGQACFAFGMEQERPPLAPGTLYLVATPIGNLEDITQRALRVLRDAELVVAEDTRHTGLLLHHYGIRKSLLSHFRFNEARRTEEIIRRLGQGAVVALVTDAGTPGVSDPGSRVVRAAIDAGFRVESVPGPCALIVALTASGLPTDEFHFVGFLPHKSGARRRELERLADVPGTLVLYESPHRLGRLLGELAELVPNRIVVVARELTKRFEEYISGTAAELHQRFPERHWRGECVVLLAPADFDLAGRNTQKTSAPTRCAHASMNEAAAARVVTSSPSASVGALRPPNT